MSSDKLLGVLKSRKFWASIVGVLLAMGVWTVGETETDKILDVIVMITSAFTLGTGLESGLEKMGNKTSD